MKNKVLIVCSYILLISGLVSVFFSFLRLFTQPLSELEQAVTIISYLIPGILTLLTGLFGVKNKSYHILIVLGTLSALIRSMVSFQGYNGIIPILPYEDLVIPVLYVILVLSINHDAIERDLEADI